MLNYIEERLLILTKTYPIPSGSHIETTCVAAVNDKGEMRRLYPIPFRLLEQESQFRKWQWIEANIDRASSDKRPESYRVDVDSIILKESVDTKNGWAERRRLFQPHLSDSFSSLEARRISTTQSLGILRVSRLITLEIEANKELEWNEKRRGQLAQQGLLHSEDIKNRAELRKLPFDFYYRYEIDTPNGAEKLRHKITDWEAGRLYWRCMQDYGPKGWETKFRNKLESEFATKDLHLLMGTMHRFQNQWLIIGLIYPPKPSLDEEPLQSGFDLQF